MIESLEVKITCQDDHAKYQKLLPSYNIQQIIDKKGKSKGSVSDPCGILESTVMSSEIKFVSLTHYNLPVR